MTIIRRLVLIMIINKIDACCVQDKESAYLNGFYVEKTFLTSGIDTFLLSA
jgi:hypothetical protein